MVVTVMRWTGREARALRDALRMSARAFATHTNLSVATIADMEAKGQHARLRNSTQKILDGILATAPQEVQQRFGLILGSGLVGGGPEQGTPLSLASTTAAGRLPAIGVDRQPLLSQADEVRRSEFLRLTGAWLASTLVPPLVHTWAEDATNQPADEELLTRLRAQTEGFRWMDRRQGAATLLTDTAEHARTVAAYWRSTANDDAALHAQLAAVAADACHLVAYQAFDQGLRPIAIEWYRCSADLAARARNRDLYVFALCGVAYMHARNGQPTLALSVLRQMSGMGLSGVSRYYLAVYEAHAHSAARDEYSALTALDHAQNLAEHNKYQDGPTPWLGVPDPVFVERQRGLILADLGVSSGTQVLSWLDRHTPTATFQRYRVTLLTSQAWLQAQRGDPERAASLLAEAVDRNGRMRSQERLTRMLQVRSALEPFGDTVDLSEIDEPLREQMSMSTAAQGANELTV